MECEVIYAGEPQAVRAEKNIRFGQEMGRTVPTAYFEHLPTIEGKVKRVSTV